MVLAIVAGQPVSAWVTIAQSPPFLIDVMVRRVTALAVIARGDDMTAADMKLTGKRAV
jgi:hypothetical protein